jgi:hypothetical protein
MGAGLSRLPGPIEIFSSISQGKALTFRFVAAAEMSSGNSDQDALRSRRGRKPPRMRVVPRHGHDVQVTVTKTVEFDVDLRLGEGVAALPAKLGDEERGFEPSGLTKEEQRMRSLELQLKHDLEI